MSRFIISGIQQIGVGTIDFRQSWNWYIDMFGIDVKILEDDTVAERMLPYTGGVPQKRHACIAVNLQGGGGFEIWQYSDRKPQPCPFKVSVGDIGIFAAKLNCRDVNAFYEEFSRKWKYCTPVETLPDGTPCFYLKDLYGNCFQIVQTDDVFIDQNKLTGGMGGAVIGVSDMDASIRFYREVLGYENIICDTICRFSQYDIIPGCDKECRRVILKAPERTGAFSDLFGDSTMELVQVSDHTRRKIYEGRYWGDPGFIQVCFDVTNMDALGAFCRSKGHPFTVDSCPDGQRFDMGDASGRFAYIEDPDGTLIEFVETYKVPVVKKLGWFLDMSKRNPGKKLPKFIFRMMGLVSKETI